MQKIEIYKPKNNIRIVTAASLFDGHDAAINVMRRIIQSTGVEVIHLGHNRSVQEIVNCAIQEDVQSIAITSYQGGHTEFFKYMHDLLQEKNAGHIKIYGGGGGVILPDEIKELHDYGIAKIYTPDDGREMGLQGMINDLVEGSDFPIGEKFNYTIKDIQNKNINYLNDFKDKTIAIISVDPSKRKTGGALLGDRIRMNAINDERVYMRSLATRQANLAMSKYVGDAVKIAKAANFDLIILETSGIGQSDTEIVLKMMKLKTYLFMELLHRNLMTLE